MSYHVISMLTAFYVNKSINQSINQSINLFLPADAAEVFVDPKQADICCPAAAILRGFKLELRLGQAGKPGEEKDHFVNELFFNLPR